jgi:hypothetical protein
MSRLEKRMGAKPEDDIVIFLHADNATMGRWTGAENVHFALPGRSELHVSGAEVPHDTLGHELAHVLGRQIAGGLLGVPTQMVFLPNAGIIEGLAMAVTPELEVHGGLTLREKAAAMQQAELAPDVEDLFGEWLSFFRFWRHPPGNAYVTAGAVVEALIAHRGTEGLAAMYSEGSLRAAFDDDVGLARFLDDHQRALLSMPLPSDALPTVKRTYSRPSILSETCDPTGREQADAIRAAARSGDFSEAETLAAAAEGEVTPETLRSLAEIARHLEQDGLALRYLLRRAAVQDTKDARELARREEEAADALWRAGRRREALARWQHIGLDSLAPWQQRYLTAKRLLGAQARARPQGAPLAEAGLDLLLDAGRGDAMPAVARLARALGEAESGENKESDEVVAFSRYLLARQYLMRGEVDEGIILALELYGDREDLAPLFRDQLLRGIAFGHAKRGDGALAQAGYTAMTGTLERAADRVLMHDRAERTRRMAAAGKGDTAGDRWLLGLGVGGSF